MKKKQSQFILLKIPPHLVRLLGKIHALSIDVLSTVLLRNQVCDRFMTQILVIHPFLSKSYVLCAVCIDSSTFTEPTLPIFNFFC